MIKRIKVTEQNLSNIFQQKNSTSDKRLIISQKDRNEISRVSTLRSELFDDIFIQKKSPQSGINKTERFIQRIKNTNLFRKLASGLVALSVVAGIFFDDMFSKANAQSERENFENVEIERNRIINITKKDDDIVVQYNDNTEKIYIRNKKGNYFCFSKTKITNDGSETEYYSEDKKIESEKIVDLKNNKTIVIEYWDKDKSQDESCYIYRYEGTSINKNYSNLLSLESIIKNSDGSSTAFIYRNARALQAVKKINIQDYNLGIEDEIIFRDCNGNIKERLVKRIGKNGRLEAIEKYNENDIPTELKNNFEIDFVVGNAKQGNVGNCYFMATMNSFSKNKKGQELLKKNISVSTDKNGEKIYTIKFPGSAIAIENLKRNLPSKKIFIKDSYNITQLEMDKYYRKSKFSTGDQDVFLYELAFNKYRNDVKTTVEKNKIDPNQTFNVMGLQGYYNKKEPIDGGWGSDVMFVLTGKTPEIWEQSKVGVLIDFNGRTVQLNDINIYEQDNNNPLKNFTKTAICKYGEEERDKLINRIVEDSFDGGLDKNIVTASINVSYCDKQGYEAHEVSVINMTKDAVTFIDPNDIEIGTNRQLTISMENFKRCVTGICLLNLYEN